MFESSIKCVSLHVFTQNKEHDNDVKKKYGYNDQWPCPKELIAMTFMMTSGDKNGLKMFIYLLCCVRVLKTVSALAAAECFLSISDEKCLIFFHFYVNSSYEMVCECIEYGRPDRNSRTEPANGKKGPQKAAGRWLGRASIRSMLASFFAPTPERSGPRLRLRRLGPDNEEARSESSGKKGVRLKKVFTCGFMKLGHQR